MVNYKILVSMICLIAMAFASPHASAGDLSPGAAPDDAASRMFTLEDIYQRLSTGANDGKSSGSFAQPAADPTAGTMHTLDEIMGAAPAPDNTNGATAADVLSGTTFWGLTGGEWGLQTGTMTEGGDVEGADGAATFVIPTGYYDGKTATATDSNLLPENIVSGVTIFGVTGNYDPGWNLHTTTSETLLYDVDMLSSTDGWAVGWGGRFYRWDGTSWSLHTDFTYEVTDVEMLSSTDGWAVGVNCIYHWDGTSWSEDTTVSGMTFRAVSMVSSTEGWAVGNKGRIFRYSGGVWTEFTPSPTSSILYDVDVVAADDVWMVTDDGYFYHWDGSSWSSGGNVSEVLYCVEMLDDSNGWAGGTGGSVFRYSNGSWSLHTDISGYYAGVNDISMVSSTEGWAVGYDGYILYYDGTTWSEYPVSMGHARIYAVDMLSSTDGWAVGGSNVIGGDGWIWDYDGL